MIRVEQDTWQRDCEQAADHHIRTCMEHERRHLARRLAEAVPTLDRDLLSDQPGAEDPLRAAVAAVVATGCDYMAQVEQCSPQVADDLAEALQRLDCQLLPSETCQAIDEAGAALAEHVKHIAAEHQPEVLRAVHVDAVREAILHSLRHEQQRPAYVSPVMVRLARLADEVRGWRDSGTDDAQDDLGMAERVATELVGVLESLLGNQPGGAA